MDLLPTLPKEFVGVCLYTCDHCEELFSEISFLLQHQKEKHKKPFTKSSGGHFDSIDENYLFSSEKKEDLGEVYNCELCEELFPNSSTLLNHKNSNHKMAEEGQSTHIGTNRLNSIQYCCNLCPEVFQYTSILLSQKREYLSEIRSALKHIKNDHDYAYPVKICELCKIAFSQSHKKINLKSGEESFICIKCLKSYYKIKQLNNQKSLIYRGQKEYNCRKCNKRFSNRKHLKRHMKRQIHIKDHIDDNEEKDNQRLRFECSYCFKSFRESKVLERHVLNHTGIFCDYCSKSFQGLGPLKVHERTHTGERPFMCDKCDAKFSLDSHLKRHKTVHTNERPFICEECGKYFKGSKDLVKHSVIHTEKGKFLCKFCPKTFHQRVNMKTHERTHTGEKPYECDQCDKRFSHNVVLKDHMKEHKPTHR